MKDFHRRVVPSHGLDKIVLEERLMKTLNEIVQFEKARYDAAYNVHSTLVILDITIPIVQARCIGSWGCITSIAWLGGDI